MASLPASSRSAQNVTIPEISELFDDKYFDALLPAPIGDDFDMVEGPPASLPATENTARKPPAPVVFKNAAPQDFASKDSDKIPSDDEQSALPSFPSSPIFKIHPQSARSSSPVNPGPHGNTSLPPTTANSPIFTNFTPADIHLKSTKSKSVNTSVKRDTTKLVWANLDAAKDWMEKEQQDKVFSFASKNPILPRGADVDWIKKYVFVCSRGSSGGKSRYVKKRNRTRKVPHKTTGCKCLLRLTAYPDRVEGSYFSEHNHALGVENARFTALSANTRREIEAMLRDGMHPSKVLEHMHCKIYDERNISQLRTRKCTRNDFITRADVRRVEKQIEQELVRLAKGDGESVLLWVDKLREDGYHVFLKTSSEMPPSGSGLDPKSFVLIIQTPYQAEFWKEHGKLYAGIDATHNTTHYENMSLFTLLARDRWGRGMPCSWMVSSKATEETISFFLNTVNARFPDVVPEYVMTDKDHAQINAIRRVWPTAMVELCWWHVLHAWQGHFSITKYPDLWALLKTWPRITDENLFQERWSQIRQIAPASVVEYLESWLPDKVMWSAIYRRERNIYQKCDTNMLVEAWHHLLKGKFMQGKRNRRLDQLIYVLVYQAMPYFIHRHHLQYSGFEGGDLEVQERLRIEVAAKLIPEDDIEQVDDGEIFNVKSQTYPDKVYCVDLDAYDCTCPSFPQIFMCKHIYAVQLNYSELCEPIQASPSDIVSADTFAPTNFAPAVNAAHNEPEQPEQTMPNDVVQQPPTSNSHVKDDLLHSLSALVHQLHNLSPSKLDTDKVTTLHDTITSFSNRLPSGSVLPPAKRVAPNQHSWPETAAVMGTQVKGKKRTTHTDAYSGGERSGKRAKEDALSRVVLHPGPTQPQAPPPHQPVSASSTSLPFDPSKFNINDVAALSSLKRPHLYQLCDVFNVPKKGTNTEIVSKLSYFQTFNPLSFTVTMPPGPARKPYTGQTRRLLLAFDIGTTFSGISYCILDPGKVPEIQPVTRYPSQEQVGGDSKIPTVIYYDKDGKPCAIGAETLKEGIEGDAEENGWRKARWFKLHLRPKSEPGTASQDEEVPPLPLGKTVVEIFADFMKYLRDCAKAPHQICFDPSNGWGGPQQTQMRRAAVLGGLVLNDEAAASRIEFVTEGEASLHFCLSNGLTVHNDDAHPTGILIVDAGGGTIDVTSYRRRSNGSFTEIAIPRCYFQGGAYVTMRANAYFEELLESTRYSADVDTLTTRFDRNTKHVFKKEDEPHHIQFASARERDSTLGIRGGRLTLPGFEVAKFFAPSVKCIIDAIKEQRTSSQYPIKTVFMVGGFSASSWLYENVREAIEPLGITVSRPDTHVNKAVSNGAVSYYVDGTVTSRMARSTYGIPVVRTYDAANPDHVRRGRYVRVSEVTGKPMIDDFFNVILPVGTSVDQTKEFRQSYFSEVKTLEELVRNRVKITSYTGTKKHGIFIPDEPHKFRTLCTVEADISRVRPTLRRDSVGGMYYEVTFDVVLLFGLTELKAQVEYVENGVRKRGPASVVYD
ncbi:hypothetical protein NMY22_g11333 [Coprinellus aureogranulatus]|nr:hypothetical protein NMY22_g11333 [Coprinellus aureogranulatus]